MENLVGTHRKRRNDDADVSAAKRQRRAQPLSDQTNLVADAGGDATYALTSASPLLRLGEVGKPSRAPDELPDLLSLSDEIIVQIFRWLPKCALVKCASVCDRFNAIVQMNVFWRKMDLGLKHVPSGAIGILISRGVICLRLAKANIASPLLLDSQRSQSKITHLDLSMACVEVSDLEELLSKCRLLVRVSLENLVVSPGCLKALAKNSKLSTLNLATVRGINAVELSRVFIRCQKLSSINLSWTGLSRRALNRILPLLPTHLERLNISGCRDTLGNEHVETIAVKCPTLIELDVSDAILITDKAVELINKLMLKLNSFGASRCYKIPPVSFVQFNSHPSLRYLHLYGMLRAPALAELKSHLPRIEMNKYLFSSVARPTVGIKRTSIWGIRVRE